MPHTKYRGPAVARRAVPQNPVALTSLPLLIAAFVLGYLLGDKHGRRH